MAYNPPGALSSTGWRYFRKEFKEKAPIRYYLNNEFKKTFIWPVKHKWQAINDWIRYRTINRYHIIRLDLSPDYHGAEEQILHANFKILKDFVEIESAWHYLWQHPEEDINRKNFFYRHIRLYRRWKNRNLRRPDFAMKYYEWAATLDDPSLPPHERCVEQAQTAREIIALYKWWTIDRAARKNIDPVPYSNQGLGILSSLDDDFDRNAPDYKRWQEEHKRQEELEQEWDEEDTEMLIRLIKIRKNLWT